MADFIEVLLSEGFWLPSNITWKDVDESGSNISDIVSSIPLCVVILVLRYLLERYCFRPVAIACGVRNIQNKRVAPNPLLEKVYLNYNKYPSNKQLRGWAKRLDWSEHQVEEWIKLRLNQNKPSKVDKFCESGWRFSYYLFIFTFGVCILRNRSWMWDIAECWKNYPQHSRTSDIWWYYMISLAFYLSLTISQFYDVKRTDFWQMFLHHMIATSLIVYSWSAHLFRIGSLVLLVHDFADITLEAAKLTKYLGYKNLCNIVFAFFTLSWIGSRMIVYPFWIVKSTLFDAPKYLGYFHGFLIFNGILSLLLCLHVFWTTLLIKLVYQTLTAGKLSNDIRSSSEDSDD